MNALRRASRSAVEDASAVLDLLAEQGEVYASGNAYRWVSDTYPAAEFGLRTSSLDTIIIQDHTGETPQVIGEVDRQTAPILVHEGAIYLHEGAEYVIERLDWEQGLAVARQTAVDYYTDASSTTNVKVEEQHESAVVGDSVKATGRLLVTSQVTGYRVIKRYTHETLGYGQVNLPPQSFETQGMWFYLTPDLTARLEAANILLRPNDYGPNWAQARDAARARDGYRCTQCGAPERPDRQHDVHHLRPFRDFGYVPGENENYREANRLENLVTLCRACHRAAEAAQRQRSALAVGERAQRRHAAVDARRRTSACWRAALDETKAPTITIYDHARRAGWPCGCTICTTRCCTARWNWCATVAVRRAARRAGPVGKSRRIPSRRRWCCLRRSRGRVSVRRRWLAGGETACHHRRGMRANDHQASAS